MKNVIEENLGLNVMSVFKCINCGAIVNDYKIQDILKYKNGFNYCPNCGTEIKEEK